MSPQGAISPSIVSSATDCVFAQRRLVRTRTHPPSGLPAGKEKAAAETAGGPFRGSGTLEMLPASSKVTSAAAKIITYFSDFHKRVWYFFWKAVMVWGPHTPSPWEICVTIKKAYRVCCVRIECTGDSQCGSWIRIS